MGNGAWTGIQEERFLEYEKRMLLHSGLPYEAFDIQMIKIDDNNNQIRTISVGDRANQTMVLMHGYGGSGVMFWKIIKALAEKYFLVLIDILGMGGSSRPTFEIEDHEEADQYLIEWLERWRIAMSEKQGYEFTNFILAGHSFGGYVCGLYATKYHQHIKKLLMLSPAGVPNMPEDFDIHEEIKKFPPERRPPKIAFKLAPKIWKKKWSPFEIMRFTGRGFVGMLLNGFVKKRFPTLQQNEVRDYKVYLHQTLLRPGSTEYAIFICFDHLMFAKHPLEDDDRLGSLPIPVSFFYGDRDWMMQIGGNNVVDKNPYKGTHSWVHIVENSDHHMYFDNPEDFVNKILKDLENLDELSKIDKHEEFKEELIVPSSSLLQIQMQ